MDVKLETVQNLLSLGSLSINPLLETLFWFGLIVGFGVFLWHKGKSSIIQKR